VLRTKLQKPHLAHDLVPRPELVARLNGGLEGRNLTLISAPVGYGKTTLMGQWLAECPRPSAWLSLDEHDSDPVIFMRYLLAAVQTVFAGACPQTLALLQAPQMPSRQFIINTMINEIADLPGPLVLALDDYHAITEPYIHETLGLQLHRLPANAHLAIATRVEPPLPLTRLRANRQMTELSAADLSFDREETRRFLAGVLGREPHQETVGALAERTEGWVAGLRLAGLSLRPALDDAPTAARLPDGGLRDALDAGEGGRFIMDYFLDEILSHQPDVIQRFLLETSILDRFSAPLCHAVCFGGGATSARSATARRLGRGSERAFDEATADGQDCLDWVARANLFLTPLDYEGGWYRYHPLFQELLRSRLAAAYDGPAVAGLHTRAGAWLASHGLVDEALHHAFAAGDTVAAAGLVERNFHPMADRDAWYTLERWLAMLPAEVVEERPALTLAQAWLMHHQFKLRAIPPLLKKAEALLLAKDAGLSAAQKRALRAEIDVLRSEVWLWSGEVQRSLDCARRAAAGVPGEHLYARGLLMVYLGLAHHFTGGTESAVRQLHHALDESAPGARTYRSILLVALMLVYQYAGRLGQLAGLAEYTLRLATESGYHTARGWAQYLLGLVHYERNNLDRAVHHFSQAADRRHNVHALMHFNSLLCLALSHQAKGDAAEANRFATEAAQNALDLANSSILNQARSFQAQLALLQGDPERALRRSETVSMEPLAGPLAGVEVPRLTRVKALIAQGSPDSLRKAQGLLAPSLVEAQTLPFTRRTVEIHALDALLRHAQGRTREALEALARAVDLARLGGFVRVFLDLGPGLAQLLYQLAERDGVRDEFVGGLLDAFRREAGAEVAGAGAPHDADAAIVEPLSGREMEVLALLDRRLTNKEIAAQLEISHLTVRTHTRNIYRKLGVNNRRQASATARALGIIPAD
jgi:LuxR family maltose regulon positive regulatory protein